MTTTMITVASMEYTISLELIAIIGFLSAVSLGSIAWYNSKRPLGWKNKSRPDIIPEVK